MRKGMEMAVQIIFVILVLMIVSVIAIQLFSKSTGQIEELKQKKEQVVLYTCQQACQSDIYTFCTKTLSEDIDEDTKKGLTSWRGATICEDSIYCPDVYECDIQGRLYTPIICVKWLCEYYARKLGNDEEATKQVFGEISTLSPFVMIKKSFAIKITSSECYNRAPDWYIRVLGKLQNFGTLELKDGILYIKTENGNEIPACGLLKMLTYDELESAKVLPLHTTSSAGLPSKEGEQPTPQT